VHPDAAATGREAVDRLRLLHYDLVLMDRWMPGIDGVAATAAIRRHEGPAHHTVVVAMSPEVSCEEHERLMDCGTDDVLLKPVRGKAIEALLRKWLPRAAPPAGVAFSAPAPRP
jgi:CheY-like chemotaxis protein